MFLETSQVQLQKNKTTWVFLEVVATKQFWVPSVEVNGTQLFDYQLYTKYILFLCSTEENTSLELYKGE